MKLKLVLLIELIVSLTIVQGLMVQVTAWGGAINYQQILNCGGSDGQLNLQVSLNPSSSRLTFNDRIFEEPPAYRTYDVENQTTGEGLYSFGLYDIGDTIDELNYNRNLSTGKITVELIFKTADLGRLITYKWEDCPLENKTTMQQYILSLPDNW